MNPHPTMKIKVTMKVSSSVHSRLGFTLIELLSAIAVIAILASILLVATQRVRSSMQLTQSVSNLRSLMSAMQLYVSDNNGRLPGNGNLSAESLRYPIWDMALLPYLDANQQALEELPTRSFRQISITDPKYSSLLSTFYSEADDVPRAQTDAHPRSYALRAWVCNNNGSFFPNLSSNQRVLVNIIENPARASVLVECFRESNLVGGGNFYRQNVPSEESLTAGDSGWLHRGATAIAFLDGHVAVYDGEDLFPFEDQTSIYWPKSN